MLQPVLGLPHALLTNPWVERLRDEPFRSLLRFLAVQHAPLLRDCCVDFAVRAWRLQLGDRRRNPWMEGVSLLLLPIQHSASCHCCC